MKNAAMKSPLIVMTAAMAALTSCHTDELCYIHPHGATVSLVYDWSQAPDAAPEGMRAWFYRQDDEDPSGLLRDVPGASGGLVRNITEGYYHIISHNNDTEVITYVDTHDHGQHCATTRQADILEPMGRAGNSLSQGLRTDGDQRVTLPPEPLWLANATGLEIANGSVVTLTPRPIHRHYTYEFIDVDNTRGISAVSASISGMSAGVWLSDGSHLGTTCTHPLEANIDTKVQRIYGDFYTFGYPTDSNLGHRMALYVVMDDGRKFKYTEGAYLDVTDQIRHAPDPMNVHIVIRGLELPTPVTGGGFVPDVDDWTEENHDIVI